MMKFCELFFVTFSFLLAVCQHSTTETELNIKQAIGSNHSDEHVLKALLMMVLKTEQMEQELKEMREICVKKDELPILVENINHPLDSLRKPTDGKTFPFMNIPYRKENIPTSTQKPVIPVMNMSSVDQMLKLLVRRSCHEWLQSGFTSSGVYTIDADGQGIGDPPFPVYCDMVTGYTFLRHDREGERQATSCRGPGCYKTKVSYSTTDNQIRALIQSSDSCHQFIKVDCFESPLESEGRTLAWWMGTDGARHHDWAGELYPEHTCACGYTNTCVYPRKSCNCDSAISDVWVSDTGLVTNMSSLPIQEVAFGSRNEYTPLKVRYTIGPLQCHGLRRVSYPSSCHDLFVHGTHRSGWYIIGEPKSLHFTFCNMESLHQSDTESDSVQNEASETIQPVDVDLADHVMDTLQSRGFVILKQETHSEMLEKERSLEQTLDTINKTMMNSQALTDHKTSLQENELKVIADLVKKNQLVHSSYIETLNFSVTSLEAKITDLDVNVVFYATTQEKVWDASVVIKYEIVHLNMGDGYNSTTGKFTAPLKGVYYIAFYTRKYYSSDTYLYMRKNESNKISKSRMRQDDYATNGAAAIVELEVGDRIDVYLARSSIQGSSYGGTSFMGYLLYKT